MSPIRAAALRSRLGGVVGATVVAALALGGCSGDDVDAAVRPTPTPSGSVTEPVTDPVTDPAPSGSPAASSDSRPPDVPPARGTAASRKAFARVVVDSWSHALQTNRAGSVTRMSKGPCQGCAELRRELAEREREGWYVNFPGAEVGSIKVRPGGQPASWIARVAVDIPASRSYFDDGTFRNDNEAHEGAAFEVAMSKDGRRWRLLGFRVLT